MQFWGTGSTISINSVDGHGPLLADQNPEGVPKDIMNYNVTTPNNAAAWASLTADQNLYKQTLEKGWNVVDSSSSVWYLDCGQAQWMLGGPSWCGLMKSWQQVYLHDPVYSYLTEEEAQKYGKQIKGGEVALWGETVDSSNLESMLLTRAVAFSERMWTSRDKSKNWFEHKPNQRSMQSRLRGMIQDMKYQGFKMFRVQPEYCDFNEEMCDSYTRSYKDAKYSPEYLASMPAETCPVPKKAGGFLARN